MKNRKQLKGYAHWLTAIMLASPLCMADSTDQEKIARCVACHGADGIGKAEQYPNLQGQGTAYLVKQLKEFKSGIRKDSSMNVIAEPLSEADIKMLANFFNQVK